MPRDLHNQKNEATLTASPESQTHAEDLLATDQSGYNEFTIHHQDETLIFGNTRSGKANGQDLSDLHPYVQTLSLTDVESCVALENATFPENERCSREKFLYRFTACPELSLGLFSTTAPGELYATLSTYPFARAPDTASPMNKSTLVAQVVATKCATPTVTGEAMELPADWRSRGSASENRGHREQGRTIAIHSLAVLPTFKGRGLGKLVMRSYMQRVEASGIANRIALLAHDHLVAYYEALGFRNLGKSETTFGGGGWNDMVYDIAEQQPGS